MVDAIRPSKSGPAATVAQQPTVEDPTQIAARVPSLNAKPAPGPGSNGVTNPGSERPGANNAPSTLTSELRQVAEAAGGGAAPPFPPVLLAPENNESKNSKSRKAGNGFPSIFDPNQQWPLVVEGTEPPPKSKRWILGVSIIAGLSVALILIAIERPPIPAMIKHLFPSQAQNSNKASTLPGKGEPEGTKNSRAIASRTPVAVAPPTGQTASQTPKPSPLPLASPVPPPGPGQTASSGAGLTSLQVASFPNEGLATGYANKLKSAGIPAYVVSAEIPHKGRWYRVRAGKFSSPQEAGNYAAAWRKQAAASGLNLQFIPCDYEP
ncbi:MAG TPA: SPOR domain-containing protein [Blastocatellia bacterium]|nr:SPOR domain-containing protein [Blastocatellia bacterium]